jgi:mannitol/fructose-specific phosphotransferase system IIA component (Ntr-type)
VRAAELIAAGGIVLQPAYASFEETIGGLVDSLIANGCLSAALREPATRAIIERENLQSTAIVEIGVAVPHARVPGVEGVMAAMAASPTAVYYAVAGVPISIVVVVLSAPDLVGDHLDTLAGVSLLLQSADTRRGIEHAADSGGALRVLRGGNGRR